MQVLVNRFATIGQKTGIGHYTAELLRCLVEEAPGDITCFPTGLAWRMGQLWGKARPTLSRGERKSTINRPSARRGLFALFSGLQKKALDWLRNLGQASLARQLRKLLAQGAFDLYHEPNTIPLPCDHPTVTTMHDLSVFLHPEWHPAGRVAYFEKHFMPSLARSQHFIAVSEFTRREMIHTLGIVPERVTRVYNGIRSDLGPMAADASAATLRRLALPSNFLLYVGTIEPRKNILMLLRAFCALPDSVRERCPLVLAGNWGWSSADVAEYFHAEAKSRQVIHAGYVADADLPALYNGARALVYPSLYEGFGLPPMEMLASGGAVLASTAEAVAEVAGRHAHLIDPHDADGWRAAMRRVIEDDEWRESLRPPDREAARSFTWDRCAMETLAVYRQVLGLAREQKMAA